MASLGGKRLRNRVLGGAAALGLAVMGAVLGLDDADQALLKLLSPPGAGYDSTNISLTTGSGGAVTFTRASTWTCQDSSGSIRSLASGKPCVVDGASLRVRSAVTNLAWPSEDMSDTARWVESAAAITTSADDATCPLSPKGVRMDLVSNTAAGNTANIKFTATVGSSVGPFTGSAWVGSTSGSTAQTVFVQCNAGAATSCSCSGASCVASISGDLCIGAVTATTTPQRVSVTTSCTLATTTPSIGLEPGTRGTSTGSGCFDLAQLVASSQPGDYCPTAGASATCAAETATVATPASLSRTEGSACFTIKPSWTGAHPFGGNILYLSGNAALTARIGYGATTFFTASDGTSFPGVAADYVSGVAKRYCTRWSAAQNKFRVENVTTGVVSADSPFTTFGAYDATLAIGGAHGGTAQANADLNITVCPTFSGCR